MIRHRRLFCALANVYGPSPRLRPDPVECPISRTVTGRLTARRSNAVRGNPLITQRTDDATDGLSESGSACRGSPRHQTKRQTDSPGTCYCRAGRDPFALSPWPSADPAVGMGQSVITKASRAHGTLHSRITSVQVLRFHSTAEIHT